MIDRKSDICKNYCLFGVSMNVDETWKSITKWLRKEKKLRLPSGSDFKVYFNTEKEILVIIPIETGIPRSITKKEWIKFANKFNSVKSNNYDPFKPGHYAPITFNSSYLVAILKEYGYSE